ncbi:MAG: tetratricopeptide repeat protein [Microcoleus sp. PH2017_29_MFU_D_A]|uniref:tetratricopeptide repeat protein n=1 Tax=unclassified Microcoleus TaxID=2642155 RepID=UPI001D5E17A4|nr:MULTISPECIES: tetratricopeptide repeat protein [unclassified Microcoleus]MCC3417249.1 tetratricopeptide repeat protein [Microcoleus sp. PH2017_07_MST_O_A]MCC3513064.1 tetratricopeptide repeat protein [Microcoleus sp. PH2017_17_BER_D_A]TAG64401.1 MAG: tetratricopeptide repeat protein [Oscillatoriales cyanobacterium]MCC3425315.1 tetratricopeptide repeat protein [Microcoleus sp. PH2017_01_SCD_O_A]MCC3455742.1 tetratricopeptide repeat protein [Microcoleus sp. PH2017_08_TRC_O_A]
MLDNDIVDDQSINEDSYDGLVSLIEASKGVLSLLIASCKPGDFQTQMINRYEAELAPNIPCYRVVLNQQEPSLRAALEQLVQDCPELQEPHASAVITVTGTEALMDFVSQADSNNRSELNRFFGYLQWTREGLREFPYPIVLWVTPKILSRLIIKAPDFWSWRSGVFRFVAPLVEATNVVNENGEISLLIESERRETLPLKELLDQVESLEQQAMETPALATLYNRVANAYANRVKTGQAQDDTQEIDRAIHLFEKSLALQRKLNLPTAESDTLLQLGDIYRDLGLWEQVFPLYEQSLEIARSLKDSLREAAALGRLGNLYQQLGQFLDTKDERDSDKSEEENPLEYVEFIKELLLAEAESNSDITVVYPILAQRQHLLNPRFSESLQKLAEDLIAHQNSETIELIFSLIENLSMNISNFSLGSKANNLEVAITGYQIVLSNREPGSEQFARTQNNLAIAYSNRIISSRADNLEKAIAYYTAALEVYTLEAFPKQWAMTQNNLGLAYRNRIRGDKAENIELAIASYAAALSVYSHEAFPEYWAMTLDNLAIAYRNRIRGDKAENIELTIASYTAALSVYTREAFPQDWAMTQNNLATMYRNRIRGDKAENIELAIASYTAALTVLTREAFPEYWATTQNNLGLAYSNRIMGEKAENIELAKKCYENALTIRTREAFPQKHTETLFNLGNLDRSNR